MGRGLRFVDLPVVSGQGANGTTTPAPKRNRQLEHEEQKALLEWAEYQHFTHVDRTDGRTINVCLRDTIEASLNGAYLAGDRKQRIIQWRKLVEAGARKSAPDITINYPVEPFHGMKIEMKKRRDQYRSPSERRRAIRDGQAEYLHLMERFGYRGCVAYGWVEAAQLICEYFGWDPLERGAC